MKNENKSVATYSVLIITSIVLLCVILFASMHLVIEKNLFDATVSHEIELMKIVEKLGSNLINSKLISLKANTYTSAKDYEDVFLYANDDEIKNTLTILKKENSRIAYFLKTADTLICSNQFDEDFVNNLDLTAVWNGAAQIYSPDFDKKQNYILSIAVPIKQNGEVVSILIEQIDGYILSKWLGDLFLPLDLGTSYIVDKTGRNIATAREENFDWITTRYNAQELALTVGDISSKTVAALEKYALEGKSGLGTYEWENSTNYVAYGPINETGWGFFIGFYGDKFEQYSQTITSISNRAAGMMLLLFAFFSLAIVALVMRNLAKERHLNAMLTQQTIEIQEQNLHIAASEERFRIAMQRSRDFILEYQLETGEIICFHEGREIKSGFLGDSQLRSRIINNFHMDSDSYDRFEEVLQGISRGLTSAECILSGDHGQGQKWYNMTLSAIPNGVNASTRAVGVLRDITGDIVAELDPLTKLLNKAAMTEAVQSAMQKDMFSTSGAFVMLDVDHFKLVNDQFGHPEGDKVLCEIASILRDIFPDPNLTGRFGGDEFSIYCPSGVDYDNLKNRLNQLSTRVKQIKYAEQKTFKVTLSIGAVIFSGKQNFDEIYKSADTLLYKVKEAGRDGINITKYL